MSDGTTKAKTFFLNLALVQSSAACSETVTFPIDNIKTRLQLAHGQISALQVVNASLKREGVLSFYNGISAAIMRHWVYTGCRISMYDAFRHKARQTTGKEDLSIFWKCLCGGSAGGLGQLIATPFDLVKVRLISDRNRSQYSGFLDCVKKIYRAEGRIGFYRGWLPSVQRALMVNIGELSTYDESKRIILRNTDLKDGIAVHTMASFMSGLVSSAISTPIDVVKSRIMGNPGMYTGSVDCIAKTLKAEGASAFAKGFLLVRPAASSTRAASHDMNVRSSWSNRLPAARLFAQTIPSLSSSLAWPSPPVPLSLSSKKWPRLPAPPSPFQASSAPSSPSDHLVCLS
jgi:solute carrier family 25 uncoupling protein 27